MSFDDDRIKVMLDSKKIEKRIEYIKNIRIMAFTDENRLIKEKSSRLAAESSLIYHFNKEAIAHFKFPKSESVIRLKKSKSNHTLLGAAMRNSLEYSQDKTLDLELLYKLFNIERMV